MPHHTGEDAAIDAEVEEIRGMNITKGSRGGYERAAAHIILFFFVSAVNLINPIFLLSPPPLREPTVVNIMRFFRMPPDKRTSASAPILLDQLQAKDFMRFSFCNELHMAVAARRATPQD